MEPICLRSFEKSSSQEQDLCLSDIQIRRPRWDPHPWKSKTNNSAWRVGLFLIFNDKEYDWMPLETDMHLLFGYRDRDMTLGFEGDHFWHPTENQILQVYSKYLDMEKENIKLAKEAMKKNG